MKNEKNMAENSGHKKFYRVDEINAFYEGKRKQKKHKKNNRNKPYWYYLVPSHFKKLMEFANASFSIKDCAGYLAVLVLAVCTVAYAYKLWVPCGIVTGVCMALFIPAFIVVRKQKEYEKKRLSDLQVYMEQVLYAFKKNPNILDTLKDTSAMFDKDSMMYQAVSEAINYIENTMSENASEEGLLIIESYYNNDRLSTVHKLLLKIERIGGEYEKSVNLLLEDLRLWAERMEIHKKNTATQSRNIYIAAVLSCAACLITVYFLPDDMAVVDTFLYQISSVFMFYLTALICFKTEKKTNLRWIENDEKYSEQEIRQMYLKAVNYNENAERKKSYIWAGAVMGISLAVVCVQKFLLDKSPIPAAIIGAGVIVFMLNQHKIGHSMNMRNVTKEINKAYPKWLMEISLRMQTDNVQVSIIDSMDNAPAVLKPALKELIEEIQVDPESISPYTKFLSGFNVQEVHSAMKMLFAIFSGRGGDSDTQIAELIARNNIMLNQAERIKNEDALAGLYAYFLMPALVSGVKIIADMSGVMILFFAQTTIM